MAGNSTQKTEPNFLLAAMVCVLTSATACVLGTLAYRRLPAQRPRGRRAELGALALPLLVVVGYVASLFLLRP